MDKINKVTSQPLSKRMYDLGWRFDVERYWVKYQNEHHLLREKYIIDIDKCGRERDYTVICPAPDAIEIGERLPFNVRTCRYSGWKEKDKDGWDCFIKIQNRGAIGQNFRADTEAEARGKMWCYLTEKGLL